MPLRECVTLKKARFWNLKIIIFPSPLTFEFTQILSVFVRNWKLRTQTLSRFPLTYLLSSGYAYVILNFEGSLHKPPSVYRGGNAAEHFLNAIVEEEKELIEIIQRNIPLVMSEDDERKFQKAEICGVCQKPLGSDKVRDHDHWTGTFRTAAHNRCNVNYQVPNHIPAMMGIL